MAVSLDKAVIARLTKSKEDFEIFVDPEKVTQFKKGADIPIDDVLATPMIFKDARKAEKTETNTLQRIFGRTDPKEIAKIIILKGEIRLTTEQCREMVESKKKQIAGIISRHAINPQTNVPHPPDRILNAMKEAGVKIEPLEDADSQVERIVDALKPIIPVSFQTLEIQVHVPAQYSGKISSVVRAISKVKHDKWNPDGSYTCTIEVPAGMSPDVLDKLNHLTGGEVEANIIKKGK